MALYDNEENAVVNNAGGESETPATLVTPSTEDKKLSPNPAGFGFTKQAFIDALTDVDTPVPNTLYLVKIKNGDVVIGYKPYKWDSINGFSLVFNVNEPAANAEKGPHEQKAIETNEPRPAFAQTFQGDVGVIGDLYIKGKKVDPNAESGSGLPEIEETDEGKVLTVVSGEAAWAESSGGGSENTPKLVYCEEDPRDLDSLTIGNLRVGDIIEVENPTDVFKGYVVTQYDDDNGYIYASNVWYDSIDDCTYQTVIRYIDDDGWIWDENYGDGGYLDIALKGGGGGLYLHHVLLTTQEIEDYPDDWNDANFFLEIIDNDSEDITTWQQLKEKLMGDDKTVVSVKAHLSYGPTHILTQWQICLDDNSLDGSAPYAFIHTLKYFSAYDANANPRTEYLIPGSVTGIFFYFKDVTGASANSHSTSTVRADTNASFAGFPSGLVSGATTLSLWYINQICDDCIEEFFPNGLTEAL